MRRFYRCTKKTCRRKTYVYTDGTKASPGNDVPETACQPSSWQDSTPWGCTSSWDVRARRQTSPLELQHKYTTDDLSWSYNKIKCRHLQLQLREGERERRTRMSELSAWEPWTWGTAWRRRESPHCWTPCSNHCQCWGTGARLRSRRRGETGGVNVSMSAQMKQQAPHKDSVL